LSTGSKTRGWKSRRDRAEVKPLRAESSRPPLVTDATLQLVSSFSLGSCFDLSVISDKLSMNSGGLAGRVGVRVSKPPEGGEDGGNIEGDEANTLVVIHEGCKVSFVGDGEREHEGEGAGVS